MVTPKATNDHFSVKNPKFSRKEFIRLNSHETHGLDQIMTTFLRKNTKFSRQEFIRPYHRQIHGLDQNCLHLMGSLKSILVNFGWKGHGSIKLQQFSSAISSGVSLSFSNLSSVGADKCGRIFN